MLAPKEQKCRHGTSGSLPSEEAEDCTSLLPPECDAPSSYQEKTADSCSKDRWKQMIQDPLEIADVQERICTPLCKGLEPSLVPTLRSEDVWVINPALAEAISGGMSRSNSSSLVIRRPGSIGYRVETVFVDQLQDVWHPLKWGDIDEVLPYKQGLKQKAGEADDNPDSPSPKKQRHVWTAEAHCKFINVVKRLGDRAVPTRILDLMQADGLTREHVASHLQKYRMHTKERSQEEAHNHDFADSGHGKGGDGLDGMLRNLGNVVLRAVLEGSGMAKQSNTISGKHGLVDAKQLDAWRGMAEPDINSNSVLPILPSDCQLLNSPRCEDIMCLPGPGIQAESAGVSAEHYSTGNGTGRTGDERFDDIFDFLTAA